MMTNIEFKIISGLIKKHRCDIKILPSPFTHSMAQSYLITVFNWLTMTLSNFMEAWIMDNNVRCGKTGFISSSRVN